LHDENIVTSRITKLKTGMMAGFFILFDFIVVLALIIWRVAFFSPPRYKRREENSHHYYSDKVVPSR